MKYFYTIVKILYYIITVFVGVFFLGGKLLFNDYYTTILKYIIPWYMVLCGIMFGYIVSKMWLINDDDVTKHNSILLKSFVIGIVLWVWLSLSYIFLK
jgi:uncharacterized membrane protein YozB (DUF420 family)